MKAASRCKVCMRVHEPHCAPAVTDTKNPAAGNGQRSRDAIKQAAYRARKASPEARAAEAARKRAARAR